MEYVFKVVRDSGSNPSFGLFHNSSRNTYKKKSTILNLKNSQWIWPSKNIQIFPCMVEERNIFINSIAIYGDWSILNIEMCPGLDVWEGNSITIHQQSVFIHLEILQESSSNKVKLYQYFHRI